MFCQSLPARSYSPFLKRKNYFSVDAATYCCMSYHSRGDNGYCSCQWEIDQSLCHSQRIHIQSWVQHSANSSTTFGQSQKWTWQFLTIVLDGLLLHSFIDNKLFNKGWYPNNPMISMQPLRKIPPEDHRSKENACWKMHGFCGHFRMEIGTAVASWRCSE